MPETLFFRIGYIFIYPEIRRLVVAASDQSACRRQGSADYAQSEYAFIAAVVGEGQVRRKQASAARKVFPVYEFESMSRHFVP